MTDYELVLAVLTTCGVRYRESRDRKGRLRTISDWQPRGRDEEFHLYFDVAGEFVEMFDARTLEVVVCRRHPDGCPSTAARSGL